MSSVEDEHFWGVRVVCDVGESCLDCSTGIDSGAAAGEVVRLVMGGGDIERGRAVSIEKAIGIDGLCECAVDRVEFSCVLRRIEGVEQGEML